MLNDEENGAFDTKCRNEFAQALHSIGPAGFSNPNAEPFLRELKEIAERNPEDDGAEAASTALSIVILLDQMPRNLYRTNAGLHKVYSHYDKISFAFVDSLLSPDSPIGRPDLHPQFRYAVGHRHWFYMPLMHSEDIRAHNRIVEILTALAEDLKNAKGNERNLSFLEQGLKFEAEHREIIERFGRYSHRNNALGREITAEEKKFLAEGGATFGVGQE